VSDVTVCILDGHGHEQLIRDVARRAPGSSSSQTATSRRDLGGPAGHRLDMLVGIGGTPEGIIAACALKCMGGMIQARLWPKDDDERARRWTPVMI